MDPQKLPLRDIHLPKPVSWWPPAPGWWLLLVLAVAATALAIWLRRRPRRRTAPRRLALRELQRIRAAYAQHGDPRRLARELSVLLRRSAISLFPRAETAGLTGEDWLDFLDRVLGDGRFSHGVGRQLLSAPYRPTADIDPNALLALCQEWVEALPGGGPRPGPSSGAERPAALR